MLFDDVLGLWVGTVIEVANSSGPPLDGSVRLRIQAALADVIAGGPGFGAGTPPLRTDLPLPRIAIRVLRGRTAIVANGPPVGPPAETDDDDLARELHAVVMLLARDERARLLRRCDWPACRAFFFAARDHRRLYSFCCETHRRLHEVAHRDPAAAAESTRRWRAAKARRRDGRVATRASLLAKGQSA